MPRIVLISAVFPPEPVVSANLTKELADVLADVHDITVLCPNPSRPEGFHFSEFSSPSNYSVVRLNSYVFPASKLFGRMKESYSFGNYCVKYIEQHKNEIDCIYLNVWPLLAPYLIVKAAKRFGLPTIVHVQDVYPESLLTKVNKYRNLLYKLLFPFDKYALVNSTAIISIANSTKELLVKTRKLSENKITVVSNWQNESEFIPYKEQNNKNNSFIFMYLGNNGPLAGVDLLIESFVEAALDDSKLIIAGSGSQTENCRLLAKSLGATNIEFISVPDGKVPEIQSQADVMLLPVKRYGAMSSIPSKLPAYMFSAKPIIGSLDLVSDTANAIKESGCGIVVKPEDKILLSEAMVQMYNKDKNELKEMGEKGFLYSMKYFSKSENLHKIVTVINQAINGKK